MKYLLTLLLLVSINVFSYTETDLYCEYEIVSAESFYNGVKKDNIYNSTGKIERKNFLLREYVRDITYLYNPSRLMKKRMPCKKQIHKITCEITDEISIYDKNEVDWVNSYFFEMNRLTKNSKYIFEQSSTNLKSSYEYLGECVIRSEKEVTE